MFCNVMLKDLFALWDNIWFFKKNQQNIPVNKQNTFVYELNIFLSAAIYFCPNVALLASCGWKLAHYFGNRRVYSYYTAVHC